MDQSSIFVRYVKYCHERTVILASLWLTFLAMILYGFASKGYQMYAIVIFSSLRYVIIPASSSLISLEVETDQKGNAMFALPNPLIGF